MQYLGKTKIGRFCSNPSVIYPQMRLPQDTKDVIGETAQIYATKHDGKRAFLFVLDDTQIQHDKSDDDASQVLQFDANILQLSAKSSVEARLSTLESDINALKSLLFSNESEAFTKIKNRWARPNSNRRPSPCKGDVITS
jgi:hypothetical protein